MEADFVIVGAGSAGCALAYRLSEEGRHSVIVVEYGGSDAGPFIQMPGALSFPMNMGRYDWGYVSEPEPHLCGRRLVTPRGKVIGGSSSINGMVYVRGHARDFDHWDASGAKGWSFADVNPYFKRMEDWHSCGHGGDQSKRGIGGPLHVVRGTRENPLNHAFVDAGIEAGYQFSSDSNGEKQEGFGPWDQTTWKGKRWSAANAYLRPALKRRNVRLVRGLALRICIEGRRAVGMQIRQGRKPVFVKANREVVLAASSINSPKLLLLSGIGPVEELKALGIPVVANRPGVGKNLQDHLEVYVQFTCRRPVSLYRYWNVLGKAWVGARWILTRSGPGASNHFESGAFIRSGPGVEYPDIQFHFLPLAVRYDGKMSADSHGFQIHAGPMRSGSRGDVTLNSADPEDRPKIRFNYMSCERDWIEFRKCVRLARDVVAQPALSSFAGEEIQPGSGVETDSEIDGFVRQHAESAFHPCGTCRMGAHDDTGAVVDPECRVIGVDGLRVADSSVFPRITNGNTNAPSIMVGEKAADHILERNLLPRSNDVPWIHPDWESSQR